MMLASVSNVVEARLALDCEVDWLDIKDPHAGALGRPAAATVQAIVALIAGRVPVSATIGDCWYSAAQIPARVEAMAACGVDYIKVGLHAQDIACASLARVRNCTAMGRALVIVCMAEEPPQARDIDALAATGIAGIMLDTADKAGRRLTALTSQAYLRDFVLRAQDHGLLTGLAGRLQLADVPLLLPLSPDYLGFRSALCQGGAREAALSREAFVQVRAAVRAAPGELRRNENSEVA